MVNKVLSHLLALIEMHIENLLEGHEEAQTWSTQKKKVMQNWCTRMQWNQTNLQGELKQAAGHEMQDLEQELE
jgi:hypothetical protein